MFAEGVFAVECAVDLILQSLGVFLIANSEVLRADRVDLDLEVPARELLSPDLVQVSLDALAKQHHFIAQKVELSLRSFQKLSGVGSNRSLFCLIGIDLISGFGDVGAGQGRKAALRFARDGLAPVDDRLLDQLELRDHLRFLVGDRLVEGREKRIHRAKQLRLAFLLRLGCGSLARRRFFDWLDARIGL